jgi:hypothetical protein
MKVVRVVVPLAVAAFLGACATGPRHSEVSKGFPALKPGEGRVYFYRSNSMLGAAIQPSITVNGKVVGDSKPGGFFYVDLPAGPVEVVTSTEVEKKATFVLAAGEMRCVRTSTSMGIMMGRVIPELVDEKTCNEEIRDASYMGK